MLDDLKTLLGISGCERDDVLNVILYSVSARLNLLLGSDEESEIPYALQHIVTEVAVARYNRIGSEGMTSHTVEGETISLTDSDFSGYMDEINAYLEQKSGHGKVRIF